ncbi:ribonuclease [Martiniozyma asiatica (nom. inval.)]|nr:ribonuclease [Martiniozyma asiatica]
MFKQSFALPALTLSSAALFFWGGKSDSTPVAPAPPSGIFPNGGSVGSGKNPNSLNIQTNNEVNPKEFFKYGFPGPVHDMASHAEFVSVYNRQTKNPYYVVEHITPNSIKKNGNNGDRKNSVFKEDESIPEIFRAKLRDYFRSGYDRGHQAPAANAKFSQIAMDETFYLTNMSPQVGAGFNRDYWAHFEDFCRRLTGSYSNVRIVTGPLYLPKKCADGKYRVEYEVIGNPPSVAVPTHFFKLVVADKGANEVAVGAFVMPNEIIDNKTPLTEFLVPLESLERGSGLEFMKLWKGKQKELCKEVKCEIIVREFNNAVNGKK